MEDPGQIEPARSQGSMDVSFERAGQVIMNFTQQRKAVGRLRYAAGNRERERALLNTAAREVENMLFSSFNFRTIRAYPCYPTQ